MSVSRRYTYRVVSLNGAGVHSREMGRCADAKRVAQEIAEQERECRVKLGPYEIERVEHLPPHSGVRYWMRQRRRWVLWDPRRDSEVRQPDWIFA